MAFGLPHLSFLGYPAPGPGPAHGGLGFREARPADGPAIAAHLARLSPEDRRLRFCASVSDAALSAHAAAVWDRAALALAGFDGPLWGGPFHRPGAVRAFAELAVAGADAEIGLSVDRPLRGRGVGTCLVQVAGALLAPRAVLRIAAYTRRENVAMLRLGRSAGARIDVAGAEAEIVFDADRLRRDYARRRLADGLRSALPAMPAARRPAGKASDMK